MANQFKLLVGSSALAAMLAACGGGGSSSAPASNTPDAATRALPPEIAEIIDDQNELTDALCPGASGDAGEGGSIDPATCLDESEDAAEEDTGYELSLNPVVQQFCPEAAQVFDATLTFNGEMLDQDFLYDTDTSFDGSATFPAACLQEAAGNFQNIGDMIGGSNPLTEQLCPEAAANSPIDPAACFTEAVGGGGDLPGGDGGLPGSDQLLAQLCPETGEQELGPETPVNCLNEASRAYIDIYDMLTASNPLTEQICPEDNADGRIDPPQCFAEALMGGGIPGGGDGGDGGSNPFAPALEQFCPETAMADLGPSTPIDCLAEAGGNFQDVQDLLLGSNPLTEQLCPEAAANSPIDPAACFSEAAGGFAPGGGGLPGADGNPLDPVLAQFCPETSEADLGPTTPIDCLTEAGGNFGDVQDLLLGSNPLTEQLCPEAAANSPIDPAACFEEAAGGFAPGGGGLPGADGNPLEPVLAQFCPATSEADLGPTTPIDCLTEAGGNFGDVQDLLLGSNPLTEQLCPEAAANSPIDPAACFEEAAGGFAPGGGGLPGADGNPLEPVLAQFCPETSEANLGPTTPIDCLTEAGGNFGDVQDLLLGSNPLTEQLCPEAAANSPIDPAACFEEAAGGFAPGGGGLPGADGNPLEPVLAQFCPNTADADLGPTTPIDCLTEAGGNFGDVQDLLLGSNPLTEQLCPEAAANSPIDPAACFEEAAGGFAPGGGGLPGADGNPLEPVLAQFCPETSEADLGPTTPIDCLTEAGGNFGDVQDLLLGSNPLTEQLCPEAAANSPIDPAACFEEAAGGFAPGGGGLPGADGNPLEPVLAQFCPATSEADLGPTTPIDCLTEAGNSFGNVEELLLGANPLTEALCPEAAANSPIDPAACFMEAAGGGLPGGGGGDNPLAPLLEQFCPETAAGAIGPTTPTDCLTEAGAGLAALEELLGPLTEPNPLTDQVCPETSETGTVDPTECFIESLDNVELLNSEQIGLLPGCPLLSAFNDEGNLSLTLGLACLANQETGEGISLESGNALTDLFENLLGGLF
ncbi:hypothetical protein [Alcanivorax sp.]|uniref:hypothetical protein n=1 Tax=Alcanivorax sp. TaxID=1872427 RepID=UPI003A933FEA